MSSCVSLQKFTSLNLSVGLFTLLDDCYTTSHRTQFFTSPLNAGQTQIGSLSPLSEVSAQLSFFFFSGKDHAIGHMV